MKIFVSRKAPIGDSKKDLYYHNDNLIITDAYIYSLWKFGIEYDYMIKEFSSLENVIIHTCNIAFLNYFSDEQAKGCFYVYSEKYKEEKLFNFSSMREKLKVMGPGEVVSDSNNIDFIIDQYVKSCWA